MYPAPPPDPPVRRIAGVVRANAGPLALAAGLLLVSRFLQIATYDPAVKGLTVAAVIEVTLTIAGNALAMLIGCWAVLSDGRAAGFGGLRALPPGRLGPFLGYSVVFWLWLMALSAVLTRLTIALMDGQPGSTIAVVVGVVAAVTVLLMYLQLGFLFPDLAMTGQTSIIFATALGLASARRFAVVLALPVLLLVLPQTILSALLFGPADLAPLAQAGPFAGVAAAAVLGVLGAAGTAACAVAMTDLYRDLTQHLPDGAWR